MLTVQIIRGYDCPKKFLLLHNGEPILFANSQRKISEIIQYIEGYGELKDSKIKRLLLSKGIIKNRRAA